MLLNLSNLIYNHCHIIRPKGAIVVGAHHFEEEQEYLKNGIDNFVLIEPAREAFSILESKYENRNNYRLFNVACGSRIEDRQMFVEKSNKGQSNSLLQPKNHLTQYPFITFDDVQPVSVTPLDFISFPRNDFNFLSIDVQCFELEVLKGAKDTLGYIHYIMSEVNNVGAGLYEGCTNIEEMDAFLNEFDFKRVESPRWIGGTWCDSFYCKRLYA